MEVQESRDERWTRVNSTENLQEEDDNDEALSLRDLPLDQQSTTLNQQHCTTETDHHHHQQHDFDFCSFSKDSADMCAADEVFHQGQILPFRRSIQRSESMDHCSSGGLITSRSSSISSQNSSTSGSGSSTADQKFPTRNLFHSHPSPSPKLIRNRIIGSRPNSAAKSSPWSVFRLGLVAPPPEIAFHDLKTRGPTGCRNGGGGEKRKIKAWGFVGGCNCAVDTVDAVPSKVVVMKRSASDGVAQSRGEEACLVEINKSARKPSSHRRTSEWLKQLSIEGAPAEP